MDKFLWQLQTNSRFVQIFAFRPLQRVPFQSGSQTVVDLLTLDVPQWLTSQEILTPHHFNCIWDLAMSQYMSFHGGDHSLHHGLDHKRLSLLWEVYLLWLQSWLLGLYHDHANFYRLCHIVLPCFWVVVHSCIMIGLCHVVVPCLWVVSCLCMLNTWSHDLGVLGVLKLTLGNTCMM